MKARPTDQGSDLLGSLGGLLFLAVFAYYWITITPYVDLTGAAAVDPVAGQSNALNQLISLLLFGTMLLFYGLKGRRMALFGPGWLLVMLLIWALFTSAIAVYPDLALKRVLLIVILTVNAAVMLILPRSEDDFARLAGLSVMAVLVLCYYGVIMRPELAIHQASEIREPMNAGLWRGTFTHKNGASSAMVVAVFFGLFIASVRSRLMGFSIIGLAVFFLAHTGGKTSMLVLPAILVLSWMIERLPWCRVPLVVGGLIAFNFVAIGAAVFEPVRDLVNALGVDPTFTNRSDIWRFAFSAIAERPWTGYGLQSFWQTEGLVYSGGTVETWAAEAYNGHNGYLDAVITMGIPGLILTLIWAIFLPLRDIALAQRANNNPIMTRLFIRIWLYAVVTACIESIFYAGGGALWFSLLFAMFGLRLQGSARLLSPRAAPLAAPDRRSAYA